LHEPPIFLAGLSELMGQSCGSAVPSAATVASRRGVPIEAAGERNAASSIPFGRSGGSQCVGAARTNGADADGDSGEVATLTFVAQAGLYRIEQGRSVVGAAAAFTFEL